MRRAVARSLSYSSSRDRCHCPARHFVCGAQKCREPSVANCRFPYGRTVYVPGCIDASGDGASFAAFRGFY